MNEYTFEKGIRYKRIVMNMNYIGDQDGMDISSAFITIIMILIGIVLVLAILTGIVALLKGILVFWIEIIREIKDLFKIKEE